MKKVLLRVDLVLLAAVLLLLPLNRTQAMEEPGVGTDPVVEAIEPLPTLKNADHLMTLLAEFSDKQQQRYGMDLPMEMEETMEAATAEAPAAEADSSGQADFSTTNIQVAGVDEGDRVKTDGNHLYRINQNQISIIKVMPEEAMELVGTIETEENFSPSQLYLNEGKLVVVGSGWRMPSPRDPVLYDSIDPDVNMDDSGSSGSTGMMMESAPAPDVMAEMERSMIWPPYWQPAMTTLRVYDVSNPAEASLLREITIEGNLLSTRKIDDALYLVANRHLDIYWIMEDKTDNQEELLQPAFFDTAVEEGVAQTIPFDSIRYFPEAIEPNYITILGLSLDKLTEPANVEVFLGRGQNIYASRDNLYIAMEKWEYSPNEQTNETNTDLYRFALEAGTITHTATGQVPGRILNQFSMDEHEDTFRIATTTGEMWRTDEGASKNHLYVLDNDLERLGQIEDIAPTERIYSVRFMGNRAYMVTFRQIDPFYVIDLKNPEAPAILGYLKIPGYSDYLHPYDENHIIGFGKEVYDVKGNAIPGGFKMAVFDVSDVTSPVEKYKLEIGDSGTDSELLRDHKALLFSKERNLIAFPITIMTKAASSDNDPWQWGQFSFQGALVYGLNLDTGFTRKAAISHLSAEDIMKAGDYWYDSDKNVDRILYVGDTLLTTSNTKVMRHDQQTFRLMDEVLMK